MRTCGDLHIAWRSASPPGSIRAGLRAVYDLGRKDGLQEAQTETQNLERECLRLRTEVERLTLLRSPITAATLANVLEYVACAAERSDVWSADSFAASLRRLLDR